MSKINKAVIVAAGLSSRLYPLTLDKPKGLLDVGGKPLLKRSIEILKKNGIQNIAVVVGYKKEMIMSELGKDLTYIPNPFYQQCNNMGSLWFAKKFISNEPFVYMHGDIIFDEKIFSDSYQEFLDKSNDIEMVTDFDRVDEEAMKVRLNDQGFLIESNKEIPLNEAAGEWTGITYIRNAEKTLEYIESVLFNDGLNYYDTFAFTKMAKDGYKLYCSSTKKMNWFEIDFKEDLDKARATFK